MSELRRVNGNRVYCHACQHEWDRSQGGLQCPECASDFVEIIDSTTGTQDDLPSSPVTSQPPHLPPPISTHPIHTQTPIPIPPHPLRDHQPWAPDLDEDDITTFEFNTARGRGTFSFTSRTYTFGGNGRRPAPAVDDIGRNLESMMADFLNVHNARRPQPMMGGGFFQFPGPTGARGFGSQDTRGPPSELVVAESLKMSTDADSFFSLLYPSSSTNRQQTSRSPFDLLGMIFNPANAQHGDIVFTQEAFDRVMTQMMDQNQGSGAPPASETAINALQKKKVDKSMMGSDGTAECSICMDNVELGDEITCLPCNHWFHGDCVISWLKEHDTCPHCRNPITNSTESDQRPSGSSSSSRRRSGERRSSSVATPLASIPQEEPARYSPQVVDMTSGHRDAPHRHYNNSHDDHSERPRNERRPSSRTDRSSAGNSGGTVGSWIRNHMPFQ